MFMAQLPSNLLRRRGRDYDWLFRTPVLIESDPSTLPSAAPKRPGTVDLG